MSSLMIAIIRTTTNEQPEEGTKSIEIIVEMGQAGRDSKAHKGAGKLSICALKFHGYTAADLHRPEQG